MKLTVILALSISLASATQVVNFTTIDSTATSGNPYDPVTFTATGGMSGSFTTLPNYQSIPVALWTLTVDHIPATAMPPDPFSAAVNINLKGVFNGHLESFPTFAGIRSDGHGGWILTAQNELASNTTRDGKWEFDLFAETKLPGTLVLVAQVRDAPEPATVLLVGLGPGGIAAVRRERLALTRESY